MDARIPRRRRIRSGSLVIALLMTGLAAAPAGAGVIDEARTALEAGEYDKVDEVLDDALRAAEPSAEALELSYEANRRAGRVVTAHRRITALLEREDEPSLDRLLGGARMAERAGRRRLALNRYLVWADRRKGKSPELYEALTFLARYGNFPERYKRLVETFGADAAAWKLGQGLLPRVLRAGEPDVSLDLTRFLVEHFHEEGQVRHLQYQLRRAVDHRQLGRDEQTARVQPFVILAPWPTVDWDRGPRRDLWHAARGVMKPEPMVRILLDMERAHPADGEMPWDYARYFSYLDRIEDADARHELAAAFIALYEKRENYGRLLWGLRSNRNAFTTDGRALVDARRAERFIEAYVKRGGTHTNNIFDVTDRYIGLTGDRGIKLLRKHVALLDEDHVRRVLDAMRHRREQTAKEAGEEPTPLEPDTIRRVHADAVAGRHLHARMQLNRRIWDYLARAGMDEVLWRTARWYVLAHPAEFNAGWAAEHIFAAERFDVGKRLALLEELALGTGRAEPIDALLDAVGQVALGEDKRFVRIRKQYERLDAGRDPLLRTLAKMRGFERHDAEATVKLAAAFLGEYDRERPLVADWGDCDSIEHVQLLRLMRAHSDRTGRHGDDRARWARTWLGEVGVGWAMDVATGWGQRHGVLYDHVEHVVAQLDGAEGRRVDSIWRHMSELRHPNRDITPVFADAYDQMGADNAVRYLLNNWRRWDDHDKPEHQQFVVEQLERIIDATDFRLSPRMEHDLLGLLEGWTHHRRLDVSVKALDGIRDGHVRRRGGMDQADPDRLARLHELYRRSEHPEQAAKLARKMLDSAARGDITRRIAVVEALLGYGGLPDDGPEERKSGHWYSVLVDHLLPLQRKLPVRRRVEVGVHDALGQRIAEKLDALSDPAGGEPDGSGRKLRDALVEAADHLAARLASGARFHGHDHHRGELPRLVLAHDARAGDGDGVGRGVSDLADHARVDENWDVNFSRVIEPVIRTLESADAPEPAFAFINLVENLHQLPPAHADRLSVPRSRVARRIPNLISVPKSDPTYELHVAAHHLSLGNATRAWELSRDKLKLLFETWKTLDADYVAWAIDQMRKQKRLEGALELAMTVLLDEQRLAPRVAAKVGLVKADTYRDMENYQAARDEYESLRNNKRYAGTPAAAEARYRLIELLIITKDYATAEQMLARLADSSNLPQQAEAYYYYARIAYEQERYRETADYLKKVRDRVMDHVEAAFLEGELALVLPGGLQKTEVEVGNPELATVAIPGRELTLKLQDANLSIARSSAAIPVVVRTTAGGDRERVRLMPSATARHVFSGRIKTSLGEVEQDNLQLELRGDDRVSYVIDPEFQKANDLDYPPKYLEVKSDARLVASSGEILTPEEEQARQLERKLSATASPGTDDDRHWAYRNDRMIRPGNPVHVQVADADRDMGPQRDTVRVTLRTSSGDAVRGVVLTEVAPHAGIFRGSVPTGIPLPKATASDTFEGLDPAALINTAHEGRWASLADAAAPKWVQVDTMSSHAVARATLRSDDLDRVKNVRLLGSLSGEFEELAAWPVGREERGLRTEYFADRTFDKKVFERTTGPVDFYARHRPNAHTPRDNFSIRYTGFLAPDSGGTYTLHLAADDRAKLWIDGELVTEVTDAGKPASAEVDLRGGHRHAIRIDFVEHGSRARLKLEWESEDRERTVIPARYLLPHDGPTAGRRDDLVVRAAKGRTGTRLDQMRRHLALTDGVRFYQRSTVLDRRDTPWYGGDGAYTARMTGTFYLPERRVLELTMTQDKSRRDRQHAYVLIDGEMLFGGRVDDRARKQVRRITLEPGAHDLEVATTDVGRDGRVALAYRTDEGEFEPLPAEWFSVDHHPELAAHVMPRAELSFRERSVVATLEEPRRLRALRWVFESFTGNKLSAERLEVTTADGETVIPTDEDFRSGLTNRTLEIAPGDDVTVTYEDKRRLRSDAPTLTSRLHARYFDGEIRIAREEVTMEDGRAESTYHPMRRFSVGDQLAVLVTDYDADVSPEADTLEVIATTSGGERLTVRAREQPRHRQRDRIHSGRFLALVKTGQTGGKRTLAVKPGERITVAYLDEENTRPGVPTYRKYHLREGGSRQADYLVYRTHVKMVEDDSLEARAKLRRLRRRRADGDEPITIYREQIVATHPDYGAEATDDAEPARAQAASEAPAVSVRAPLLFALRCPARAKHSASELTVRAVAQSELDAARREDRPARVLKVPVSLTPISSLARAKGYPIQLRSHVRRDAEQMLADGVFAGIIRLQIGSPGDAVNDLVLTGSKQFASRRQRIADQQRYRVPTMIVSGRDVVHLKYEDPETGEAYRQSVRLLADAHLQLLDHTFTAQNAAIHLGERFHVQVTDPDRDLSDRRDVVEVDVAAASGDRATLKLTETLAHSGVFTSRLTPTFRGLADGETNADDEASDEAGAEDPAGEGGEPTRGEMFRVAFGDTVTFSYVDRPSLTGGPTPDEPRRVVVEGRIHHGADARLASFTKQFDDPEMAVKTSFLTAEALFELAKQYRKLDQPDQAEARIARGKRILREALDDYPDTTLKAQGAFLLANLEEESGNYRKAIARYSEVIRNHGDSAFAARSQFKKGLCFEKLEHYDQACEEYVRVIYVYSDHADLVAKATVRLGRYYYQHEKYQTAGRIFYKFQQRNPHHELAPMAVFLAGSCHKKMESYREAAKMYKVVIEEYRDARKVRAEAMYWLGDCYYSARDYVEAYRAFKKLTWDYPESKYAKIARGRLTERPMVRAARELE
ncbi:MAG: PA14 domain-containing protein [Planctomycetota bacterium]